MEDCLMQYFVVMCDYGDRGLEAVVDPALTRDQIIARIKSREYDNIVWIDRVQSGEKLGTEHQSTVTDVTQELIDAAEAELEEPFGDDLALPAAVIPPVR
jgi:hypothetical protein